jgi:hypothetical protein
MQRFVLNLGRSYGFHVEADGSGGLNAAILAIEAEAAALAASVTEPETPAAPRFVCDIDGSETLTDWAIGLAADRLDSITDPKELLHAAHRADELRAALAARPADATRCSDEDHLGQITQLGEMVDAARAEAAAQLAEHEGRAMSTEQETRNAAVFAALWDEVAPEKRAKVRAIVEKALDERAAIERRNVVEQAIPIVATALYGANYHMSHEEASEAAHQLLDSIA